VVVLVEQQLTHLSALHDLGPMLRFFKYFRKKMEKKIAFCDQNCTFFEKNADIFAENCHLNTDPLVEAIGIGQ
jgi:hypothetical protein